MIRNMFKHLMLTPLIKGSKISYATYERWSTYISAYNMNHHIFTSSKVDRASDHQTNTLPHVGGEDGRQPCFVLGCSFYLLVTHSRRSREMPQYRMCSNLGVWI